MARIRTAAAPERIEQLRPELLDRFAVLVGIEGEQLEVRPVRLVRVLMRSVRAVPGILGQTRDVPRRQTRNPIGRGHAPYAVEAGPFARTGAFGVAPAIRPIGFERVPEIGQVATPLQGCRRGCGPPLRRNCISADNKQARQDQSSRDANQGAEVQRREKMSDGPAWSNRSHKSPFWPE